MTDITNPADRPRIVIQTRRAAEHLKSGKVPPGHGKIGFVFDRHGGGFHTVAVQVTPEQLATMRTQELADYLFDGIMAQSQEPR